MIEVTKQMLQLCMAGNHSAGVWVGENETAQATDGHILATMGAENLPPMSEGYLIPFETAKIAARTIKRTGARIIHKDGTDPVLFIDSTGARFPVRPGSEFIPGARKVSAQAAGSYKRAAVCLGVPILAQLAKIGTAAGADGVLLELPSEDGKPLVCSTQRADGASVEFVVMPMIASPESRTARVAVEHDCRILQAAAAEAS